MVRIGVMNLMVHGLTNPRFKYQDTMSKVIQRVQQIRHRTGKPTVQGQHRQRRYLGRIKIVDNQD